MFEDSNLVDDLVAEVRKHPGIVGGTIAVLAGVGFATLFLRQRTGPRRYEVIKDRLSPRQWAEELGLADRLSTFGRRVRDDAQDVADTTRDRAYDLGHDIGDRARDFGSRAKDRALDFADEARDRFDSWRHDRRRRHKRKKVMGSARQAAETARDFASDHAREGAALLTVGLIAAAIGAIAFENRKLNGE